MARLHGVLRGELDAFGHMLRDHAAGHDAWQIVERHDGHVGAGVHPSSYFAEHDEWPRFERMAMEHVAGRVLDVGCGAGRFLGHLRALGHEVVGIDRSEGAVEVCKARGLDTVEAMSLERVDGRLGVFDTILLLGGNLGLLGPPHRGRAILRRWHQLAASDVRLLVASRDPRLGADEPKRALIEQNERDGRLAGECLLRLRYRRYATPWFDYLPLSADDLRHYLDDTGWRIAEGIDGGDRGYVAILRRST